jgi:restriction system protein
MAYIPLIKEKIDLLNRCLTCPTEFLEWLDIIEKLDAIYQWEMGGKNYIEVYKSLDKLESLAKKGVKSFDDKYIFALKDFRDKLLKSSFDFIEIGTRCRGVNEKVIIDESKRLTTIINDIYRDNNILWKISSREFEEIIGELFREKKYQVELTKQTKDNGYDLIAIKIIDSLPIKFLIECKRHRIDRPVGIQIIRSFNDVINSENANKGILVTTSYFSPAAIEKQQKTQYKLDLKSRLDILNWISEYYHNKYSW